MNACFLPQLVRVAVASQQHYGVSMTRGLAKPEGDVIPVDQLAANVRTQIEPFENALRANPADVAALVQEAAVFDQNKLDANSLAAYRKIAAVWTDAVWVRGRIFELEESLATQAALKAAEISPDAKTYALLIGISKYQKLPQDLWLKFADADAKTFSQHLASARGGGSAGGSDDHADRRRRHHSRGSQCLPDAAEKSRGQERHDLRPDRRPRHRR